MHQAIPYRAWTHSTATATATIPAAVSSSVSPGSARKLVLENAIVVFGRRGCCMCYVVKQLLLGHGVNPTLFEVSEDDEVAVIKELARIDDAVGGGGGDTAAALQFPVVFVGGKMFGGLERVMAAHISGELVPVLKDAGALWL